MPKNKLFMLLLGCKPKGRHTEQHDIFFTIGTSLKSIVPDIKAFWPDGGTIHIDAWREITHIDGHKIDVVKKQKGNSSPLVNKEDLKLFFINLGGYKPGEFEEFHYRTIVPAITTAEAIKASKQTYFYLHTGFKGASSHIDDKYGIDVDDVYAIDDILPEKIKTDFSIVINPAAKKSIDEWHIGYTNLSKIK
jgi:hypothetical protein